MSTAASTIQSANYGLKPVPLQTDIQTFLEQFVQGQDVLDVGCVDHTAAHAYERQTEHRWLHARIKRAASTCVGLDIQEAEAAMLNARGYDIRCGDACSVDLGLQFSRIVAGEIIEHIDTPGTFLRNMARHLRPGGKIAITTPNAFYGLHFVESIFCNPYQRWNHEHVQFFDSFTLQQAVKRAGLFIEAVHFFSRSRKLLKVMKWTGLPCYSPLASSICVIARREV
jgi:2-polyprenyl-3-methyl-5-hydroxy-6-metoxy-1,4-benzoquinol methylase